MEKEPEVDEAENPFKDRETVDIEVKGLYFSYDKSDHHSGPDRESRKIPNQNQDDNRYILKNINMRIKGSGKVAIVGASGSGKTTLANILNGFYPLEEGEILYGGTSNRRLKLATIRENIYLILQHPKLFNDTMRFNLTLGNEHSEAEIARAIEIAQLSDVIAGLEKGLDTLVGKDGIKLSGGQRQRVAIARMVLADPKVVIFDESTSALDVHTEAKLFEALHGFLETKTVITIAHRLSTIKSAEYIFVLEEGRLVDEGTPQALLQKDESYFSRMI
jgi:ATP-binding cassette subfamily C protein